MSGIIWPSGLVWLSALSNFPGWSVWATSPVTVGSCDGCGVPLAAATRAFRDDWAGEMYVCPPCFLLADKV